MTRRPPRLALDFVARVVPDSEPLIGDLQEEFARRNSRLWLWWQCLGAVVMTLRRDAEIRPLRLVEQQPLDAIERTLALHRRRREVSPTPSPLPGSLGLVILGGLVTALAPVIWWGLLITFFGGLALAAVLTAAHKRQPPPSSARRLT
jgi:hypothetical protein